MGDAPGKSDAGDFRLEDTFLEGDLGDAAHSTDAGDFRFEDTFLEDDLGDAACSTDAGDFRLDDTFMEDNLLTTRGGDVMELVDAGADALDFDFFFFIVESQIYESCLLRRL